MQFKNINPVNIKQGNDAALEQNGLSLFCFLHFKSDWYKPDGTGKKLLYH